MPTTLSIDAAVTRFGEMARRWYTQLPMARTALDEFLTFYQEIRVTGATLDEDGDEIVIEYGPSRKIGVTEFKDFRFDEDEDEESDEQYLCLSLSRTVFQFLHDDTAHDFDGDSVEFALQLYFSEANGNEEFISSGGSSPKEVDTTVQEFMENSVVKEMLLRTPQSIAAYAGGGG